MISQHLMRTLDFKDIEFVSGNGTALRSVDGNDYIDFFTDVGTASLGYASKEQKACLIRLLGEDIPVHAPNLFAHRERNRAAGRLCAAMGMDRVFFCNSGAEAVEAAIKLARRYRSMVLGDTRRQSIWTYKGGFHGRTYGALAAGDGPVYHNEGFGPHLTEFFHFVDINEIPMDAGAVCLSPVFGNNDVRVYPDQWLRDLRSYCDQRGILLIFDEVQTGAGRSGAMSYGQRVQVAPDIMTLAKGIGMGYPVGACLARGDVSTAFVPGSHFSTFGGNPASCVFVNGMLDWLENNIVGVENKGNYIRARLAELKGVSNVRGVGMLIALDYAGDGLHLAARCREKGLLIGAFRPGPGPVKITPPLNIGVDVINAGLDKFKAALEAV